MKLLITILIVLTASPAFAQEHKVGKPLLITLSGMFVVDGITTYKILDEGNRAKFSPSQDKTKALMYLTGLGLWSVNQLHNDHTKYGKIWAYVHIGIRSIAIANNVHQLRTHK